VAATTKKRGLSRMAAAFVAISCLSSRPSAGEALRYGVNNARFSGLETPGFWTADG
jgi:hypothetical protein